jgi:hypothetical protein
LRAPVIIDARQNRFPRAPLRGVVLDPARPARCAPPVFEQKEGTMIALYDHIQELRAELRGCCMTRRERAAVQAELAAAIAAQAKLDRVAEVLCRNGGR